VTKRSESQPSPERMLGIYLNDHLAGSVVGSQLARRTVAENDGTALEAPLRQLAADIEADRRSLLACLAALGVRRQAWKEAAAWSMEKAGRLKLNGRLTGYSPLSLLVEVEALQSGVRGKWALWHALLEARGEDARLSRADLTRLLGRAEAQSAELDRLHAEAARRALAANGSAVRGG